MPVRHFTRARNPMAITDWPEDERPRERLLAQGAAALSDAELLALFLRVGVKGKSAVDLARELIGHFRQPQPPVCRQPGRVLRDPRRMGPAKYAQLQAVLEMARRALGEELKQASALSTPGAVRDYLRLHLAGLRHEVFFALWLDAQNRLISAEELFRGSLTQPASLPARSGQGRAGAERGRRRVRAQPIPPVSPSLLPPIRTSRANSSRRWRSWM